MAQMQPDTLGRYRILGELGRGAMGIVYEALDPLIERKVAIKTIRLDLSDSERQAFEERFFREAKSAGQLIHPNIVTIFDAGKSDDLAYITMEVLNGPNLRDLLDKHAPITPSEIANILAQAAEALAFAHSRGIVHRDIKPGNIILLDNRHVKIADFGIAQLPTGSHTLAGTILGSPKYMSPEQLSGKEIDGRSDIFSLGVVLYEMLTGEAPFYGDNVSAIMYQVLHDDPPPPSKLNPRLPTLFNQIVAKALHKNPDARYASAAEMARELREAESMLAIAPTVSTQTTAEPRKNSRAAEITDATIVILPDPTHSHQASGNLTSSEPVIASAYQPAHTDMTSPPPTKRFHPWRWVSGFGLLIAAGVLVFVTAWWLSHRIAGSLHPVDSAPLINNEEKTDKPVPLPNSHTRSAIPQENGPAAATEKQLSKDVKQAAPAATNAPATVAPAATATLNLTVLPWAEVYVDGEMKGVSPPLVSLELPAGKHTIEFRNSSLPTYSIPVRLKPGEKRKIRYQFK